MAGVERGTFHDLRRTAICNWFREGMREYDVMKLAGHVCGDKIESRSHLVFTVSFSS